MCIHSLCVSHKLKQHPSEERVKQEKQGTQMGCVCMFTCVREGVHACMCICVSVIVPVCACVGVCMGKCVCLCMLYAHVCVCDKGKSEKRKCKNRSPA